MPRVLISVISLNRYSGVRTCLEHLWMNARDFDLVLTNQASTDRTRHYFDGVARRNANVTVFHEERNTGFIYPNDRAFRLAIERGIPYLLLLNDDTQPPPGFLDALIAPLEADELGALCGPAGGCCTLLDTFHGYDGDRYEYVEGSCLLARVDRVRRVVGDQAIFDPNLRFIYGDDSNLSLRMREAGFRIHRAEIRVPHQRNQTTRSPHVAALCHDAQRHNHAYNSKRWAHYLKTRRFDYPTVIRRKHARGDVLLTTPVIAALKQRRPLSPIHVETDFPELFNGNHDVTSAAYHIQQMPDEMRINLDMAYENAPGVPIIEAFARTAGIELIDRQIRYFGIEPQHVEVVNRHLPQIADLPIAAIHPANSWPGKTWPAERWDEIARFLMSQDRRVVLIGADRSPEGIACDLDLRGVLQHAGETAYALMMSCLFVGIDSFPMHLAMSQGTPAIGLFGVSSPDIILSEGEAYPVSGSAPCSGERHRISGAEYVPCDGACMRSISVDMVKQEIIIAFAHEGRRPLP